MKNGTNIIHNINILTLLDNIEKFVSPANIYRQKLICNKLNYISGIVEVSLHVDWHYENSEYISQHYIHLYTQNIIRTVDTRIYLDETDKEAIRKFQQLAEKIHKLILTQKTFKI